MPLHRRILALPVDGRPVVRAQVQQLVACAGWQLVVPDVAALGHFRQGADRDALHAWVLQQAPQADGVVLSLDMLLYGGLVPSRFIEDSQASLLQRLSLLADLKAAHPQQPVYAFAATMRLSNNNVADEEKPYWAQYGQLLWQWSFHSDRAAALNDADAQRLASEAAAHIPAHIQHDYTTTRARNFALTCAALQATQSGLIDRLVLPQDDTAAWGFNIAERRQLQARVQEMGLQDKVLIYAGADEVLHTLCAHLVQHLQGTPPLRVALAPSDPAHIGQLHALYEDRPVLQSVFSQLQAVGAVLTTPAEQAANALDAQTNFGEFDAAANLLLALHTQGANQGDWAMQKPLPQRPGLHASWLPRLWAAHGRGLPVALVDLAYANGGDPWLLAQPLPPLFTYAGWNTASNSLGSALAHAALVWAAVQAESAAASTHAAHTVQAAHTAWSAPASTHVLALRLLEDGLYQAVQRQTLRGCLAEGSASAADLERLATQLVLPWANAWAAQRGLPWRVQHVALPWQRTFEIDLQLQPVP
jgi:Protein of unknown function (DUF4127)